VKFPVTQPFYVRLQQTGNLILYILTATHQGNSIHSWLYIEMIQLKHNTHLNTRISTTATTIGKHTTWTTNHRITDKFQHAAFDLVMFTDDYIRRRDY
jgi:hypothetical protein